MLTRSELLAKRRELLRLVNGPNHDDEFQTCFIDFAHETCGHGYPSPTLNEFYLWSTYKEPKKFFEKNEYAECSDALLIVIIVFEIIQMVKENKSVVKNDQDRPVFHNWYNHYVSHETPTFVEFPKGFFIVNKEIGSEILRWVEETDYPRNDDKKNRLTYREDGPEPVTYQFRFLDDKHAALFKLWHTR